VRRAGKNPGTESEDSEYQARSKGEDFIGKCPVRSLR